MDECGEAKREDVLEGAAVHIAQAIFKKKAMGKVAFFGRGCLSPLCV